MKIKLLSLSFILLCSSANVYANVKSQVAICDGKRALISVYTCKSGSLSSNANCVLLGIDSNGSGTWDSGDSFIIVDLDNKTHPATYDKVKSLPNVAENGYLQCA
ncbi:hypothetical protein [Pectobacterium brasiliense]|uniref:hypothetical protein n=1 Tax=Pectobacterium brasiliense TaxID=180957 RepID=UPI0013DF87BC|nr:hypothetical protein [Pectobacterium brasiliense]GLY59144.1 hypothetical protein Pcaca05_00020 [Pectobacterium carotovorum subsp. carotovorum]